MGSKIIECQSPPIQNGRYPENCTCGEKRWLE